MTLTKYSEKRNFAKTPEPKAVKKKTGKALEFVVQRHYASHLHYDFRLEMDGVLKSWAVPKGPSMNPGDKRLAMMVEDHPFEYRKFAGSIPEGNYGAGEVEIWDQGNYLPLEQDVKLTPEKELLKELKAGSLKIVLNGKHLKGEFALVKIKNGKQENAWLLIKHKDKYAVDSYDAAEEKSIIVKHKKISEEKALEYKGGKKKVQKKAVAGAAAVGRKSSKKKVRAEESEEESITPGKRWKSIRSSVGRTKLKDFIVPMLAKSTEDAFDDDGWIFEVKWDGYRAIAETGKELRFYSRNGISFLSHYPEIEEELKKIKTPMIIDGEIVATDEKGMPSFQLLQNFQSGDAALTYYVFDILKNGKKDLTELPLLERKEILKGVLQEGPHIKYSDHVIGQGIKFFEASKKKDLEGIMAKKADSEYAIGVRTGNWLKIKNNKGQEAIIAGFTAPRNSRKFFGSLVLGVYDGDELKYCGHTGTGFDDRSLEDLHEQLIKLKQAKSPFKEEVKTNMPVTWVKPVLVCNVKFTEITKEGIMRHPVFEGLRIDKKASEVVEEKEVKVKTKVGGKGKAKETTKETSTKAVKSKTKVKPAGKVKTTKKEKVSEEGNEGERLIGKQKVKLTNLNKIYFPKDKITKGDIINYYQSIAKYILPYLKDRPQSLLRTPNGIDAPAFFHKDAGQEAPAWVKSKKIFSESANKNIDYLICNDAPTLAYLNNMGCIELNPWHSRISSLDKPDYIAIDLDPSAKNSFSQVIEAALAVKEIFDKAGADCYCKTSGSTGIHIYVPLGAKYNYDQVKDFTKLIAMMASELVPGFTTLERSLKKRGDKHIYMDYLQNRRGQTLASVYSVRPKPGATVSTPLQWKEVNEKLNFKDFTIYNTEDRIKKHGDLFKGVLGKGIDLVKCISNLEK